MDLDGKKIAILATDGFEQAELEVPRDRLKKAGATGKVRPTLEVVLIDTPAKLRRKKRADIGIALIDLEAGNR